MISISSEDGLAAAFLRQRRVILALTLRNMRTRYIGNGLGFLIAIAWPLSHALILAVIHGLRGQASPLGEDPLLFFGVGTAAFQAFQYPAQFMMSSVLAARPLFGFPEVKVLDAMMAGVLLETLSCCFVTIILALIGWSFGVEVWPRDVEQAFYAFACSLLLGVGIGSFNCVLAMAIPMWGMFFMIVRILLWIGSGVFVLPDTLPEPMRTVISYNPMAQTVEWMRSAYYEGIGAGFLDRAYPVKVGICCVFLGLLSERLARGHLLAK
jgi:capsular polysaccharide transport system permease protein